MTTEEFSAKLAQAQAGDIDAQAEVAMMYFRGDGTAQNFTQAFHWFLMAAEQGHGVAQNRLGYCYNHGKGVECDIHKAVEWYMKSAKQGISTAQCNLGDCFLNGRGVTHDYHKAVEWYTKSAEQGYANAQNNLGYCYYNGNGVEEDKTKAVEWYTKAAEQGHVNAQFNLGNCYYNGNGVEEDDTKAVEWYTKAAEQGHAKAQFSLGKCYYNGNGVEEDDTKAVEWFTKAAEQGNANAQNYLGNCYYYGNGVEEDETKAVEWYTKAAEQGHANAQNNLGDCYYNGNGVEEDETKAVEWYTKAAEQGLAKAQFGLGKCYYNGNGVEEDDTKAVEWYTKAAEQGHAEAQFSLGNCYYNGNGVEEDEPQAVVWYTKAAEQGYAEAQYKLGDCYYYGNGVEEDETKAVEWYTKAAEQENVGAIIKLAHCYQTGEGVAKDLHKAKELYELYDEASLGLFPLLLELDEDVFDGWRKELDEELAKEANTSIGVFPTGNSGSAFGDISVVPAFERQRLEEEARKKAEEEARRKAEEEAPRREFERLLALAEQGDVKAQCQVASSYLNGKGVDKCPEKGFEIYLKLARQGNTLAMSNVGGECYFRGNGVQQNFELAVYWMKKAWEAGDHDDWNKDRYGRALFCRGAECAQQMGEYADKWQEANDRVLNLLKKDAPRYEIEEAQRECDKLGMQCKESGKTAFQLYLNAADYTPIACQVLAMYYRSGLGVDKDLFKAKEWADKAFEAGVCDGLEGDWIMSLEKELEEHKEELAEKRRQEEARKRREAEEAREAERLEAEEREEEERQSMEAQGRKEKRYLNGIGVFSVAPDRKVAFSAGTLLYNTNTQEWSFADNQYSAESEDSDDSMYVLSEFAWGSGNLPMGSPDIPDEDYENKGFYDWGNNAIINGGNQEKQWRTLSAQEWDYLLHRRPRAKDLWGFASFMDENLDSHALLMLIPDGINPQRIKALSKFEAGYNGDYGIELQAEDLEKLEQYGIVFLNMYDFGDDFDYDNPYAKYWSTFDIEALRFEGAVQGEGDFVVKFVDEWDELHPVRLVRDL